MAYVSDEDGDKDIYVVTVASDFSVSGKINLTSNSFEDLSPDWSTELLGGYQRIAFSSNRDGNFDIYTMRADGGGTVLNISNHATAQNTQPKWSPNSNYLAYTTNRQDGNDLDVYAVKIDASTGGKDANYNHINLTTTRSQNDEFVAWDPQYTSGYRFAFVTDSSGVGENFNDVYTMAVNSTLGTPSTPIGVNWNTTFGENNPDW